MLGDLKFGFKLLFNQGCAQVNTIIKSSLVNSKVRPVRPRIEILAMTNVAAALIFR